MTQAVRSTPVAFAAAALLACATSESVAPNSEPVAPEPGRNYLRLVTVRDSYSTTYLMHWPKREMPLKVYLPPPSPGLFDNPDEIENAVRDGILDWADAIEPGLPSFEFVDDQGDADIPIVWAEEPAGDWYIAFLAPDVSIPNRFGVSHILVTGRWRDGRVASTGEIYDVTLHEMGHALGLMGHSDNQNDVMWPSINRFGTGLSDADVETLRLLYERPSRRAIGRRGRR